MIVAMQDTDGNRYIWDELLRQWVPVTGAMSPAELANEMDPVLRGRYATVVNVLGYGADPTGVADSTAAFVAAAADGLVYAPQGQYKLLSEFITDTPYGGITGDGFLTQIVCPEYADRYLAVETGTVGVSFTNFRMIGPGPSTSSDDLARAITYGLESDGTTIATEFWTANGWLDNLWIEDFGTALHFAYADHMQFGTVRIREVGNAQENRGYGLSTSGRHLRGGTIEHINTTTRGRHAVYYTAESEFCHIDRIIAQGFDRNPFQARISGGGRCLTFGTMLAIDCNTVPVDTAGVAYWGIIEDETAPNASYPSCDRIEAIDCGGKIVTVEAFSGADIGEVVVSGHEGFGAGTEKYIVELRDDAHAGRIRSIKAAGLTDADTRVLFLIDVDRCAVDHLRIEGTYGRAAQFAGDSSNCRVSNIEPISAPGVANITNTSSGTGNVAQMGRGYESVTITDPADTTPDVSGRSRVILSYSGACSVTNFDGGAEGQVLEVVSTNANATLVHADTGNTIKLNTAANRAMGTRKSVRLTYYVNGASPRWLEAD